MNQRLNGLEPKRSQKAIETTKQHLAAMAKLHVKPGRLLLVMTPDGTVLYEGYEFTKAATALTDFNHSIPDANPTA
jgi:hypothetical protein